MRPTLVSSAVPPTTGAGPLVFSREGGDLIIHDLPAAIEVAKFGLHTSTDPLRRMRLLQLASVCQHWLWRFDGEHLLVADDGPLARQIVELQASLTGMRAGGVGDLGFAAVLGDYTGVQTMEFCDAMAALLWRPSQGLLNGLARSTKPIKYLAGAVRRQISGRDHVALDARMMRLDGHEYPAAMEVVLGIDIEQFVTDVTQLDPALANAIRRSIGGSTKEQIGPALYQRMLYFLHSPRGRAIARRALGEFPRRTRPGVMLGPEWYETRPGRLDSVWHRRNRFLLR